MESVRPHAGDTYMYNTSSAVKGVVWSTRDYCACACECECLFAIA